MTMTMTPALRRCVKPLGIVLLALPITAAAQGLKVRILQTNYAGDNISIIDPATNEVVGEITGIEANHGVAVPPDGSRIYVSNEADETLDVVDSKSLKVTKQIPLTAHPNNVAITRDGRKVYVAIHAAPGGVDVIDTTSLTKAKNIPLNGMLIHNPFVTPDGKYLVAASDSPETRIATVIDTQSDQPVWSIEFEQGRSIRPLTFSTNPDGSTKWMFVNLGGLHGFVVVDFATHKEIKRITLPEVPGGLKTTLRPGIENVSCHGLGVSPDGKIFWTTDKWYSYAYAYSLPDLKLLGGVPVGVDPMWVTFTPDSSRVYVSNAASNSVSVIDARSMKEVARIQVGQVPRRNLTALLP